LSERRACKLIAVDRSSYRYEPRPDGDGLVRAELIALARRKPRFGYRRLGVLLARRGFPLNPKKLYRLYREEHLAVRRLKRKRLRRDAVSRNSRSAASKVSSEIPTSATPLEWMA
jgi:putative transposase